MLNSNAETHFSFTNALGMSRHIIEKRGDPGRIRGVEEGAIDGHPEATLLGAFQGGFVPPKSCLRQYMKSIDNMTSGDLAKLKIAAWARFWRNEAKSN